jgi:hypothetical protein
LRLTSLVYQTYRVGWQAIPIVVLITFLIGAIIAQQGICHFRGRLGQRLKGRSGVKRTWAPLKMSATHQLPTQQDACTSSGMLWYQPF